MQDPVVLILLSHLICHRNKHVTHQDLNLSRGVWSRGLAHSAATWSRYIRRYMMVNIHIFLLALLRAASPDILT
jgi:hypothetical protein